MPDWMPSLNALRAFESVSRHLSYRAAAEELRVTPGAVKQLVSKLEDAIGLKLVERRGHRLVLTPVGQIGKTDLALAMRHLTDAVRNMRRPAHQSRLIVTVESSLAATWLVPRLQDFWTKHPEIDVLIDSSQKIADLNHSDVDVAIRYGVPSPEGLVSARLFEDFVAPACSPALALGPPRLKKLNQLHRVPLIHWDMSHMSWAHATRRWFDWEEWAQHMGIEGLDTSKGRRFSDYGLAVQAAASGQGVILAGKPTLKDSFAAGLLITPFEDSELRTDIGFDVVSTTERSTRPEVVVFVDWLMDIARETQAYV